MSSRSGRARPWLICAAGLGGLAVAIYLTQVHYQGAALACTTTGPVDCDAVLHSSYALVPRTQLPVTLPGMAWFAGSALAGAMLGMGLGPGWLRPALLAWSVVGVGAVLYLVRAEVVVIGRLCEWCTLVHLLVLATFFLSLREVQLLRARPGREVAA